MKRLLLVAHLFLRSVFTTAGNVKVWAMSGRDLFVAAIAAAVFPDGEPTERPKTALERTIEAHEAGIGLRSSHGAMRRERFIAKVRSRRQSDKKRNEMRKASQRRNRA